MSIQATPTDRRDAILAAAQEAFSRYGYRRTSMEDVADLAGVSRPLLYTHFKNKADLFLQLAKDLYERVIADVDAAWPKTKSFEQGLVDSALAKSLPFYRLLRASPHGAELWEEGGQVALDLGAAMHARFIDLIVSRLPKRKDARALARMVSRSVNGIKSAADSEEELAADIRALAAAVAKMI